MSEEEEDESSIKSRLNKRQALEATKNSILSLQHKNIFKKYLDPKYIFQNMLRGWSVK